MKRPIRHRAACLAGGPVLCALLPVGAALGCDDERAERVLAQCTLCHTVAPGEPHMAGPNLAGVVGRRAATAAGFAYSKAFRALALDWSAAELDRFLQNPLVVVPGTSMAFAGLHSAEDRAAVICRLGGSGAAGHAPPRTMADILGASAPSDWRTPDPEDTLYLELASGRVVIELAPAFAPRHVANVRALARARYFDGLAILRVHDNYVVQWGDPDGQRPATGGVRTLPGEFDVASETAAPFTRLPDGDVYAPEVGFAAGWPVARDPQQQRAWLTHCYGMVGAGRDIAPDSGGGTQLYVVIGHAPRHLDRNVTLLGRVLHGMELLTALPRGSGPLGFYERAEQRVPLLSVRVAADLPATERTPLEVLRTDTSLFTELVESRRNRREEWFRLSSDRIELCNVPLPVRPKES